MIEKNPSVYSIIIRSKNVKITVFLRIIIPKASRFLRIDLSQKREFDRNDTMVCSLRLFQICINFSPEFLGISRNHQNQWQPPESENPRLLDYLRVIREIVSDSEIGLNRFRKPPLYPSELQGHVIAPKYQVSPPLSTLGL